MDDELPRPTVVVLMAEHGPFLSIRSPRRDRTGDDYVVDPAELGVSAPLIEAMTEWNAEFEWHGSPGSEPWGSPEAEAAWWRRGLTLAYRLQHELGPDIEVRYHDDGGERPVIGRRGP